MNDEATPVPVNKELRDIRDIAIGTRSDISHLREELQRFMNQLDNHESRLRYLEINGAKISQDNAIGLKEISVRVDCLEEFANGHKAATQESGKIAAIIAGIISITGTLIGIGISLWAWGRA